MRRWIGWLAVLLGALGCNPEPGPNIVLVTLDTLRLDHIGVYGDERGLTPRLDALAKTGVVHENAFTTMPTTGPAHASLLTGLAPVHHGLRRNGSALASEFAERLVQHQLGEEGYATGAFVTSSLLSETRTGFSGFDRYESPEGVLRPGAFAAESALRWLDAESQRPVFLWLHIYDPHAPYGDTATKRRTLPVDPKSHAFVREARFTRADRETFARRYEDGVRAADAALGTLLDGIAERLADPLIIVAGDHGETLDEFLDSHSYAYDHGEFLHDAETRIPLVVAGSAIAPGRSPAAVSIRDIYTTILESAGIGDPVAHAEGRRDLRTPSHTANLVVTERRTVGPREREKRSKAQLDALDAEALWITDGENFLLLGEDGSVTRRSGPETGLFEIASERLSQIHRAVAEPSGRALDPQTREALRALGYAD